MPSALKEPIYHNYIGFTGDLGVPQDIYRRRKDTLELMMRLGSPVLVKRRFNDLDVIKGIAQRSPNMTGLTRNSSGYNQPRQSDPLSYGVGFTSIETTPGEYFDQDGNLIINPSDTTGLTPAPTYRGYGPGYLTYAILPDVPEDVFKITESGALIRTQQAQGQFGPFPNLGDNDLLITVQIDPVTDHIVEAFEYYELKRVQPVTMRGFNRYGRREIKVTPTSQVTDGSNRYIINQVFEMTKLPHNHPAIGVEIDR